MNHDYYLDMQSKLDSTRRYVLDISDVSENDREERLIIDDDQAGHRIFIARDGSHERRTLPKRQYSGAVNKWRTVLMLCGWRVGVEEMPLKARL